jgi:hypothetical protein
MDEALFLQERHLSDLSTLRCRMYACSLIEGQDHPEAIIIAFEGEYGYASAGNGDADFMAAMTHAALAAWSPSALIFDLREMTYEWGDAIVRALAAGEGRYIDAQFPTAIIVSPRNRDGLTTLIRDEIWQDPADWLFDTMEDAILTVRRKYEQIPRLFWQ